MMHMSLRWTKINGGMTLRCHKKFIWIMIMIMKKNVGVNEPHVDCSNAFNTSQVIIDNLSHLVELMFCMKINMFGLRCRYLVLEMMFCSGLEQLPMKMDLLQ